MLSLNFQKPSRQTYRPRSHCQEDAKGTGAIRPDDERPDTQRALVGGEVARRGTNVLPVNRTRRRIDTCLRHGSGDSCTNNGSLAICNGEAGLVTQTRSMKYVVFGVGE